MADVQSDERHESETRTARVPDNNTSSGYDEVKTAIGQKSLESTATRRSPTLRRKSSRATLKSAELEALGFIAATVLFTVRLVTAVVLFIVASFESVVNFLVNLYHVCLFSYNKPDVAKDLAKTAYHLLKVSYDNKLLTLREIYSVVCANILGPMSRANTMQNLERRAERAEKERLERERSATRSN